MIETVQTVIHLLSELRAWLRLAATLYRAVAARRKRRRRPRARGRVRRHDRVATHPVRYCHIGMRFGFTESADKFGVPHEDAEHAVLQHVGRVEVPSRRRGTRSFMFVGLSHPHALRYLEVGVAVDGTGHRQVFHAMEVTDLHRHHIPPADR